VVVNPVIEPLTQEKLLINEGCLSVPNLRGDVPRLTRIRVHYVDRNGEPGEVVVEGLTAGTFQHEIDHLDGKLFLDRADPRSLSTWEEFERHHQADFLERIRPYA
jgi:peptide deformylase